MMFVALMLLAADPAAVKPSITVVVRGPEEAVSQAALDQVAPGIELRRAPLPNVPAAAAPVPALPAERIAAARKAYVNADFARCLEQVSDDAALTAALGQQDRASAARVLLWRVACNVGGGKSEPAKRSAEQLAVLGLQVPAEAGSVSPEVEAVIAKAFTQAAAGKPVPLELSGTADAQVELDGRPTGCTTPCTLEVLEGSHVVRLSADGNESVVKLLRVAAPKATLELVLPLAPPELASAQWSARYRAAGDADGARSVRLLSTALRAARLVMVTVQGGGRLQALLAIDGDVTARAEREGELKGLMEDLLVRGQVLEAAPPIYKRALFWIAIVGAAGIAGGVTAFALTRPTITRVNR